MNPDVQGKTKRTLSKKLKQLKSRREHSRRVVRTVNPTQAHESRIYSDYAVLYDKTFGKIFCSRIKHVIESLHISPGAEVLELGVVTARLFLLILDTARLWGSTWRRTCWPRPGQRF
jgi:hypothetical protein